MSRVRSTWRAGVLAILVLVAVGPIDAAAQAVPEGLATAARAFGGAWERGDAGALVETMVAEGIRLHLKGEDHPALSARLARAALADLHDESGSGAVTIRQIRALGGDPGRGFVEMGWRPLPHGSTRAMEHTVFASLELRDGGWRVVEVRVLDPGDDGPARQADDELRHHGDDER